MDLLYDFNFLRPWWWLALPVVVGLFWLVQRSSQSDVSWSRVISPKLLKYILIEQDKPVKKPLYLLAIGLFLGLFALAGPTVQQKPVNSYINNTPTFFLLDVSWSMNATDIKPTRLQHAKITILEWMQSHKDIQHALIAYAGSAYMVVPVSFDSQTIEHFLPSLIPEIMPSFGGNVADAVKLAINTAEQSGTKRINLAIITDGITSKQAQLSAQLIKDATDINVNIAILAIGKAKAVVVHSDSHKPIQKTDGTDLEAGADHKGSVLFAELTDGIFVNYSYAKYNIKQIAEHFESLWQNGKQKANVAFDDWEDIGFWLLWILLPMSLFLFRRGWFICLLLLPIAKPSQANSWDNLWLTPNQRAIKHYNKKEFKRAGELFTQDNWQAVSAYKNKDYTTAKTIFAQDDSPAGKYNLATTLAKLKKTDKAIKIYDDLINNPKTPENIIASSKYNKKILEDLQKKQNKDNKNKDNKDKKQNKNKDNKDKKQNKDKDSKDKKQKKEDKSNKKNQDKPEQPPEKKNKKEKEKEKNKPEKDKKDKKNKPEKEKQSNKKNKNQPKQKKKPLTRMEQQQLQAVENDLGTLLQRKFRLQFLRNKNNNPNATQNQTVSDVL